MSWITVLKWIGDECIPTILILLSHSHNLCSYQKLQLTFTPFFKVRNDSHQFGGWNDKSYECLLLGSNKEDHFEMSAD